MKQTPKNKFNSANNTNISISPSLYNKNTPLYHKRNITYNNYLIFFLK